MAKEEPEDLGSTSPRIPTLTKGTARLHSWARPSPWQRNPRIPPAGSDLILHAENLWYQRLSVGLRQAGEGKAVPVGRQLRGSPGLSLAGVTAFQGGQASASGERKASATLLTGQ